MKKTNAIKLMILFIGILVVQMYAYCQPREPRPLPPIDRPDWIEQLQKDLNLSETQIKKIEAILDTQKIIIDKYVKSSKELHKAMMEKRKETEDKIATVLDDKQINKFEKLQKQLHKRFNEQRHEEFSRPPRPRDMPHADRPPMQDPPSPPVDPIEHLKKELELTESQTVKVRAIFKEYSMDTQKPCESVQEDSITIHQKLKKIDEQIVKVLNDKQKEKFTEMQKQRCTQCH
jgi:Spy/CpxP family protein refolding chaperone